MEDHLIPWTTEGPESRLDFLSSSRLPAGDVVFLHPLAHPVSALTGSDNRDLLSGNRQLYRRRRYRDHCSTYLRGWETIDHPVPRKRQKLRGMVRLIVLFPHPFSTRRLGRKAILDSSVGRCLIKRGRLFEWCPRGMGGDRDLCVSNFSMRPVTFPAQHKRCASEEGPSLLLASGRTRWEHDIKVMVFVWSVNKRPRFRRVGPSSFTPPPPPQPFHSRSLVGRFAPRKPWPAPIIYPR